MITRNIELATGDSWTVQLTLLRYNSDAPEDITHDTVYLTAKASASDSTPLIRVAVASHIDPTHGVTEIGITADQTAILPATSVYDLVWRHKVSTDEWQVYTLVAGKIFTGVSVTALSDKTATT